MRLFTSVLAGLFAWLVSSSTVQAFEVINDFKSEITINQDTSLTIEELIDYETSEPHHGIFRYIPLKYRVGNQVIEDMVNVKSITDENGKEIPYSASRKNDSLYLKIGDPDITFSGVKTYKLTYTVDNAIKRFENQDELYWDITGEGWQVPITSVQATIKSPYAPITKTKCYSGPISSDDGLCKDAFTKTEATFSYDEGIGFNDNVTVVVGLSPQSQLIFPSRIQQTIKTSIQNWFIPFLFVPLFIMFVMWYHNGRDLLFVSPNVFDLDPQKPQTKKSLWGDQRVPFVYEPLKDLTPGEAGAMLDEKTDNQDIVSEIIDLARKGFLKISTTEKKGIFSSSTEYTFEKIDKKGSLPKHQETLLSGIFGSAQTKKLSDLKGKFYTTMAKVKTEMDEALTQRKLYTRNPGHTRGIGIGAAILLNVITFLIINNQLAFVGSLLWYALFGFQAFLSILFGLNLVQKTAVGSNLSMQAKGLKRTIAYGKWREEIKEKHLFIEEVLPFAVALGVVSKLTKDMKDLGLEPPKYIASGHMNPIVFNSMITDFSTKAASSLAYNPSSSSRSGGSGFSGGFSGGGGGGGGGGSW